MIVSASYKTDIPAFYGDWFNRRLEAGHADVRNPWSGAPFRVRLDPDHADGFVFWTRNAGPFMPTLERLHTEGRPFVVQMTVTGYPRPLERSVIDAETAARQIRALSDRFGRRSVVWRYDPVLISDLTPPGFHRDGVARFAETVRRAVDEVVLSFATVYRKTRANLDRLGIAWRDPPVEEKRALLEDLAEAARVHGIAPTLCAQPELLVPGLSPAACIDAVRLSDVAGREIAARTKGNRPGCACAESRDIGAYDTCPHGCVYCYAVSRPATGKAGFGAHDPAAESLSPRRAPAESTATQAVVSTD